MKKIILALLISITSAAFVSAQNLVPNPSFELYDTCPDWVGEINHATLWFQPTTGTPDYYNACYDTTQEVYSYAGVPGNLLGRQFPRTGRAYAGEFFEYHDMDYREYCEIQLSVPLQTGTKYFVSFYVSLSDSTHYATDDFSAYFSVDTMRQNSFTNVPVVPHMSNVSGNIITSRTSWVKVSGTFIADSAYHFITIGNFKDDLNTDSLFVPGGGMLTSDYDYGYYYIDDVCVSTDSSTCTYATGIQELPRSDFRLYPNPASQSATLEFNNPTKQNCTLTLYDSYGKLVQTISGITADKVEIERKNLSNGLYYFQLYSDKEIIASGKLTIE
jgi:hypothetical protein